MPRQAFRDKENQLEMHFSTGRHNSHVGGSKKKNWTLKVEKISSARNLYFQKLVII